MTPLKTQVNQLTHRRHSPLVLLPNTFRAFYGSFQQLYPIQEKTITPIMDGKDVIIQSGTGSGKTEAVLAPCMERVITSISPAAILYIIPTKALAIDIFRRFEGLITERLGYGVAIRTGDIKKKGGKSPALMLSTPESLDVMLGSSNRDISGFLARIRTIVIDEVYPFIHQYRGRQLAYLLQRLERRSGSRLQKIALSATLADFEEVSRFFDYAPDTAFLTEPVSRHIVPRLVHLLDDERELSALIEDLYREWKYHKILVFANSRGRCDKIFGLLNRSGVFQHRAYLHYSNLSAKQRKHVERSFREKSRAICVATSTLELGIDVGDVDAVVLFEPPDSVATFMQRIGRANRRQTDIHFWGICRGEFAGEQALRFLALLYLARQGQIEAPLPKRLPSVLSQQVVSCLYEKKRLSRAALQQLFTSSEHAGMSTMIDDIVTSLAHKHWLRESGVSGIYTGGWRYRDALLEYRIWSNFPETEQEYSLIVSGDAVADIPLSIVRQLEIGDIVLLTGRRLRILWIDEGRHKKVLTEPIEERLDTKEILWVGMGCHVTFETAQAMRDVLKSQNPADNIAADGLFSRTRKLIAAQLEAKTKTVVLANSIEVILTTAGLYQFRTYLGAIGNMILSQSIKDYFAKKSEDVYLLYDEIGVTCSTRVCFEELSLPLKEDDVSTWITQHFKSVRAMFPLNAFCTTLPSDLLRRELADFILDHRLLGYFKKYAHGSSEIVSGDPKHLNVSSVVDEKKKPQFVDTTGRCQPFLLHEQERWATQPAPMLPKNNVYRIRPVTGTMMGEYFRHRQCNRWLCYHFLPPEDQPPKRPRIDDSFTTQRITRGIAFETQVINELNASTYSCHVVAESDADGNPRPLETRHAETCDWLYRAIRESGSFGSIYLAQGVLMHDALLSPLPPRFAEHMPEDTALKGVGIPDLIRVSHDRQTTILEIGDIKSTMQPRYHQKWQIAFYAYMLNAFLQRAHQSPHTCIANTGFLIVRSPTGDSPMRHTFDLKPYLTSIGALFKNIGTCLSAPPDQAFWQLQSHCVSCPYFEWCYPQALMKENIQFIPRLTPGELLKLRALGLKEIADAAAWFDTCISEKEKTNGPSTQSYAAMVSNHEKTSQALSKGRAEPHTSVTQHRSIINTDFSPGQKQRLHTAVNALLRHKIGFDGKKTQLFPSNTATRFFIHLLDDPLTMRPFAFGLGVENPNQQLQTFTWSAAEESDWERCWHAFSQTVAEYWQKSVAENGAPQIFLFGSKIRRHLYDWAMFMRSPLICTLFQHSEAPYWTDLRHVLHAHFALPIPGNTTFFALTHALGLAPQQELPEPDSLLHPDRLADIAINSGNTTKIEAVLTTVIALEKQLHQWITSRLKSDWNRDSWNNSPKQDQNMGHLYYRFIETEQRHHQNDIKHLQTLSLAERVARFRAIGPLSYTGKTLDDEGRFLYTFTIADTQNGKLSKFRRGDFLKLAPLGIFDLQSGMPVILEAYHPRERSIQLYSRQKRSLYVNRTIRYSLEEDADDRNSPKLMEVLQIIYFNDTHHPVRTLLNGKWEFTHPSAWREWLEHWLQGEGACAGLNRSQKNALNLPFRHALSLVQGPPGTGKTHLLGWILIALIRHAQANAAPLRIFISAVTHHAIDHVLTKVTSLINTHKLSDFPARCCKIGQWSGPEYDENNRAMQVEPLENPECSGLPAHLILGGTGYGIYNLMKKCTGTLPEKPFDWIIFDEASQILAPYAMLSLIYGKGNSLFLGDIHQLPPVIRSPHIRQTGSPYTTDDMPPEAIPRRSILELLLQRYPRQSAILETSYRMNGDICDFPSRTWYGGMLHSAPQNRAARLTLSRPLSPDDPLDTIIDPNKPVVLVRTHHSGNNQESSEEADIMARIAHHLLHTHQFESEQLAIISPHRAQNTAISRRLSERLQSNAALPLIDTVERIQGAERDVILFGFTCSDPDHVLSEFLNSPNRFNVAITRARKKLIVVCSHLFIETVAQNENDLRMNACFKSFFEYTFSLEAQIPLKVRRSPLENEIKLMPAQ